MKERMRKLRTDAGISQAKLAEILNVTPQAVQKWESGVSIPDTDNLIRLAGYFGVSLDWLVRNRDRRLSEEIGAVVVEPDWAVLPDWENYSGNLMIEYRQCVEEGLDVERYADFFHAASKLPMSGDKKKIADAMFDMVRRAERKADYRYIEPSDLAEIRCLCEPSPDLLPLPDREALTDRIRGAWLGRAVGCMLGKTVEGIRTNEMIPFLKESGNYPMYRYILSTDITDAVKTKYGYPFASRHYADRIQAMPIDDDTNYTVLAQILIERCGRSFTPRQVAQLWLDMQPKNAYCTAERVAFCNFVKGYQPPASAMYQNPYREWIGAQIRGDYFGYINPGDPEAAAEMAFRDASISHVKNGIYGEMFVAAMIARAAVSDDISDIIQAGLSQIPSGSRLREAIGKLLTLRADGATAEEATAFIHRVWNENDMHDWCHTISNAMIVVTALLWGEGMFGRSICLAVQTCFDTDCNGATVGSILGMRGGTACIGEEWSGPINGTIDTSIFGVSQVKIEDCVQKTLSHLKL